MQVRNWINMLENEEALSYILNIPQAHDVLLWGGRNPTRPCPSRFVIFCYNSTVDQENWLNCNSTMLPWALCLREMTGHWKLFEAYLKWSCDTENQCWVPWPPFMEQNPNCIVRLFALEEIHHLSRLVTPLLLSEDKILSWKYANATGRLFAVWLRCVVVVHGLHASHWYTLGGSYDVTTHGKIFCDEFESSWGEMGAWSKPSVGKLDSCCVWWCRRSQQNHM